MEETIEGEEDVMERTSLGMGAAALAAILIGGAPAGAQMSHEEHEVHAAVEQIFEGMRTANPDLVRAVFATDARFAMVGGEAGGVSVQSVDGWLDAIASSERRWDERVYDVDVRVDGAMASVWAPYTFYLDGAVRHCGINSIELLRDDSGWRVTQISDTRRTEGCPDPLGG
jgi:hypothetical protein